MNTLGRNTNDLIIVDVSFALYRIIILPDCCNLTIFIKFNRLMETKKIDIYADYRTFSNIFMRKNIYYQLGSRENNLKTWKFIFPRKMLLSSTSQRGSS